MQETAHYNFFTDLLAFAKGHLLETIIIGIIAIAIITILTIKKHPQLVKDILQFFHIEKPEGKRAAEVNLCQSLQSEHEKKLESIEAILKEDVIDRKKRQKEYDKRFDAIEAGLEKLYAIVASHEELQAVLSQGTLTNMVLTDGIDSIFMRLKAYLRLIGLEVNGRVKKKGFELILAHKETWLDVLETMPHMKLVIVNQKYFDDTLEEINRRIFDGMMR